MPLFLPRAPSSAVTSYRDTCSLPCPHPTGGWIALKGTNDCLQAHSLPWENLPCSYWPAVGRINGPLQGSNGSLIVLLH